MHQLTQICNSPVSDISLTVGSHLINNCLQDGGELSILTADEAHQAQNGSSSTSAVVNLASNLFVGGIPPRTEASMVAEESELDFNTQFGGCIKDFMVNGRYVLCFQNQTSLHLLRQSEHGITS